MTENTTNASKILNELATDNSGFVAARKQDYFAPHMNGQSPVVTLVACSDSRVQSTALFADPIGKVFTIENIGNQLASCEGSVDYGILHLKTPILMILGHVDCGAIKAHAGDYQGEPHPIRKELDSLDPAFSRYKGRE